MQVSELARIIGRPVFSSDHVALGEIGGVYVPEGGRQPLLVEFSGRGDDIAHIAPLFGAELSPDGLVLSYTESDVDGGPTIDVGMPLSRGEVVSVLNHYRPGYRLSAARPLTERVTETGDVGSADVDVRAIPPLGTVPPITDEDLPPIVVTKPGLREGNRR